MSNLDSSIDYVHMLRKLREAEHQQQVLSD